MDATLGSGLKTRTVKVIKTVRQTYIGGMTDTEHIVAGRISVVIFKDIEGNFFTQMAFCSPKEQFNRKKGVLLACRRLTSKRCIPLGKLSEKVSLKSLLHKAIWEEAKRKKIYWVNKVQESGGYLV